MLYDMRTCPAIVKKSIPGKIKTAGFCGRAEAVPHVREEFCGTFRRLRVQDAALRQNGKYSPPRQRFLKRHFNDSLGDFVSV